MHALAAAARRLAQPVERVPRCRGEPLGEHADGLFDDHPGVQRMLELADLQSQALGLGQVGFRASRPVRVTPDRRIRRR